MKTRIERQAERFHHEVIVIIDRRDAGEYICATHIGSEFERLSRAELEALKARRGNGLLVVSMEDENAKV